MDLPVIAVSGTPAECGGAYGRAAAELIVGNVEAYRERFAVQVGLDTSAVRLAGARFRETTHEYAPRIGAMLDAVADAAGVDASEIYALNARTELLYGSPLVDECTLVGVLEDAAGHTTLGQNWDWHPEQRPFTLLLATRDERGFTVATLAEAGMVAKAGLNSAGVGVCVSLLGCDRDGRPGGVPYHVLLRMALESDCLTTALRSVCPAPRSASINMLLGQAGQGPGGGEVLDIELVPGDLGVKHPAGGLVTHANHLETGLPVRDRLKDLGGSSWFRSARAERLLRRAATAGPLGRKELGEVFADHLSYPHAICRHVDESDGVEERSETIYSILLDLDDRRLAIAPGPPCGGEYTEFTLGELVFT